ncbi:MAG: electron transport complex subunit RsxB [Aeromonadaceae bacterium]
MNHILIVILIFAVLALLFGLLLGYAAVRFKVDDDPIVEKLDALLPQTQCGQCGYPGCKPYAQAIAGGDSINKCVPGGEPTIKRIAELMGVEVPVDGPTEPPIKQVAFIHEDLCIGCTKCIQACPVDAIVGSAKMMHTVLKQECTGCDLCVAPCPTDCIEMIDVPPTPDTWNWDLETIPVRMVK